MDNGHNTGTSVLDTLKIIIYLCGDDRDEEFLRDLDWHSAGLRDDKQIIMKDNQKILPGNLPKDQINRDVDSAHIILLLISKFFFSSELCDYAMKRALERHKIGKVWIIPILLSPCYVKGTSFAPLEWLPKGGKAISQWPNRDEAYLNIIEGTLQVITEIRKQRSEERILSSSDNNFCVTKKEELVSLLIADYEKLLSRCDEILRLNPNHPRTREEREETLRRIEQCRELKKRTKLEPNRVGLYKEILQVIEDLDLQTPRVLRYLEIEGKLEDGNNDGE